MDFLYELLCIPKGPQVNINDLKGRGFNQFLDKSLRSAESISRDAELKRDATDELYKLLSTENHGPADVLLLLNNMFESAKGACHFNRELDLIQWLQVCVSAAVQYGLDPDSIMAKEFAYSKKPAITSRSVPKKSPKKKQTKKVEYSDEDETDVSWKEDASVSYGDSEDDYVPSEEDALVPSKKKKATKKQTKSKPSPRKKKNQDSEEEEKEKEKDEQVAPKTKKSSNRKEATIPVIKEGAGSMALVKYFMDLNTNTSNNFNVLSDGYFARSFFFPSKDSFNAFLSALNSATKTIDICVFAFTDDDVADTLIAAKERGVKIKIITDNQQAAGKGADAMRLQESHGIPFKTDKTNGYMHNKFAIIDSATLINGSFNWSKGARFKNKENVIITNIPTCIKEFQVQFDALWEEFS